MENPNIGLKQGDEDDKGFYDDQIERCIGYVTDRLERREIAELDDFVRCFEMLSGVQFEEWKDEICTDTVFKNDYWHPLNAKELATDYVEYLIVEK